MKNEFWLTAVSGEYFENKEDAEDYNKLWKKEEQKEVIHVIRFSEYEKIKEDLKEYVMDFLNQACGKWDRPLSEYRYDHMCLSTYENAIRFAVEQGWIRETQLDRAL